MTDAIESIPETVTLAHDENGVCVLGSIPASEINLRKLTAFIKATLEEEGGDHIDCLNFVNDHQTGECEIRLYGINPLAPKHTIERMFYVQSLIFHSTGERIPVDLSALGKMERRLQL